jgi:sensor domain CHASE-containing protein
LVTFAKPFAFRIARLRAALSRTSVVPATIATLVLLIVGWFADYQNNILHRQAMRSSVLGEVSVIRAKLEGTINANLQLVRGLIASIASEPDMDQVRFSQLASILFEDMTTQLRSIAVAPDFVIRMTYLPSLGVKLVRVFLMRRLR